MVPDHAARQAAVEHPGSIILQAPAGSGKTSLLTQRYLRLLARVDAPERIIALTFTRRAAQEMSERVVAALRAGRDASCPAELDHQTWRLAAEALAHLDAVGVDPVGHPARLRIETLDTFNGWLAAQLPIAARSGARLTVQPDARAAYRDAASRALSHDQHGVFGAAVERVLYLGDLRWSRLVDGLASLLGKRERWLPLLVGDLQVHAPATAERLNEIRRQFDEDLAWLVARTLEEAAMALGAERLQALGEVMRGIAAVDPLAADLACWRNRATPLGPVVADLPGWRALVSRVLTQKGTVRKNATKTEGFPPGSPYKQRMQDLLEEISREPQVATALAAVAAMPEPRYGDSEWQRVRDVAQVLILAVAELEGVFRERGAVDFPAVAMAARRALASGSGPSDLALRLDYRLQHLLIDEFQDTSVAQLELIGLLTAGWQDGDGRSVFCVGDPMQSIYGFREAEVGAFLRLAEQGIGQVRFQPHGLTSNFRSAAVLVDWVNATFARLLPERDDRERGAVAYRPSQSQRATPAQIAAGVSLQAYPSARQEADAVAALIVDAAARHPQWRIAVLVRARTHAHEIAASLHRAGCAFRAVDLEPLQSRPVVRDLIALSRALLHLGDRPAWLAVLRAPWAGLTLADLLVLGENSATLWETLHDQGSCARLSEDGQVRCERVRRVLTQAFAVRGETGLARWIERTWLALGGPACAAGPRELGDARSAFARLQQLDAEGIPDTADFEDAFDDLYASDDAPGAVEIMTIHKSKGLQFDFVLVPALERATSNRGGESLLARQFARPDREGLLIAARPSTGAPAEPLFDLLHQLDRQEAGLEAERLLYVACTRAKWRLHLSAVVAAATPDRPPPPARAGSLLSLLAPLYPDAFLPPPADPAAPAVADPGSVLRGGPLVRVPVDFVPLPIVADDSLPTPPPATISAIQPPIFDWAGEVARQVGSLVHAELQHWPAAGTADSERRVLARRDIFMRWFELRGLPRERVREAGERTVAALIAVCRDPRARWILGATHRDAVSECALSGRWEGRVVRVVFDRSFVADDGFRWVIDYKTSQHQGGGLAEFLERELARYRDTMERYARFAARLGPEPVRLGLYFPLLSAWREWAPGEHGGTAR